MNQSTHPQQLALDISTVKYCGCGCGQSVRRGNRFVRGHNARKYPIPTAPRQIAATPGLCGCGCGQHTRIAERTVSRMGWVADHPKPFINGHNARRAKPSTDPSLFWELVDVRGPNECWLWLGRTDDTGHGMLAGNERSAAGNPLPDRAHRIAWKLTIGPIPKRMCVCHDCPGGDNPACCNPRHLFLGTRSDNIKDMWNKGRSHAQKLSLSASDKAEIRTTYAAGGVTQYELAARYGKSQGLIWKTLHEVVTPA